MCSSDLCLDDIPRKGMFDGVVGVTLEGIPDQILKWKGDVPRLAGMEIPEGADLPSVHQIGGPSMGPRRLWYFVRDARGEQVPRVVVAVAVVHFYVGTVCDYGPILADLIEGV